MKQLSSNKLVYSSLSRSLRKISLLALATILLSSVVICSDPDCTDTSGVGSVTTLVDQVTDGETQIYTLTIAAGA